MAAALNVLCLGRSRSRYLRAGGLRARDPEEPLGEVRALRLERSDFGRSADVFSCPAARFNTSIASIPGLFGGDCA